MTSFWAEAAEPQWTASPLREPLRCEVAVVGGGFTGLASAYHLARAGVDVGLFEARELVSGASGQNGGQVLLGWPRDLTSLAHEWGDLVAEALWTLSRRAVARVAQLIDEEDIRCQWRQTGHVDAATTSQEVDALQAEREWLIQHGHQTAVWWSADAMRQRLGTPYYRGGLFDEQAWAFHPRQYGWGLALAARRHGARLFSHTPIIRVVQHPGPTYELVTGSGFSIQAKHVLWATNGYLPPGAHWLRGRIVPVYSAQIAVQLAEPSALPLDLPTVSDTSPEYHYFSRVGPDLVIFGGRLETHARRQGDFSPLEDQWRQLFPTVGSVRVTHRWAGRIALSQDFMPHIVQWAPGCWFAGGYTGHGAALSTEFGAIMATLATGGHVPGEVETLLKLPWRPLRFRRHWRPGARATIGDGRHAPLVRATIRV